MWRGTSSPWRLLILIVCLGFGLRGLFILETLASGGPERLEYHTMARNILSGQGYVYGHLGTIYRSYYAGVTYIGMTAALYALWPPGQTAVLLAQAVLAGLRTVIVFLVGRRLWDSRVGVLAALLSTLHPGLFYYDVKKLHPLGMDALLIVLSLALLLWARGTSGRTAPFGTGLVLGLATLQRASLLLFLPLAWVWFGVLDRQSPRRSRALSLVLGTVLVVGPWVGRNLSIHGLPIFLTTTAEHFWIGNAPRSLGSAYLPTGERVIDTAPEPLRSGLQSRDELGQYFLFWDASGTIVRERPVGVLAGMAKKFFYFWTFAPQTGVRYPAAYKWIYLAYYALVVLAAAVGARGLWRRASEGARGGLVLLLALFCSVSLVHSLFYGELRHRWALESLILVLAAGGVVWVARTAFGGARSV